MNGRSAHIRVNEKYALAKLGKRIRKIQRNGALAFGGLSACNADDMSGLIAVGKTLYDIGAKTLESFFRGKTQILSYETLFPEDARFSFLFSSIYAQASFFFLSPP